MLHTFAEVTAFYGDPLPHESAGRGYIETIAIAKIFALQTMLGQNQVVRFNQPQITTKAPAKAKRQASSKITAEQFWNLYAKAVANCVDEYGENWRVTAPINATLLVTLPNKYRSFIGKLGTKIKYRADQRIPAARFWEGFTLPYDLTFHTDYPRETANRAWVDNRQQDNECYGKWQNQWAKKNGLVCHKGVWRLKAE